MHSALAPTGLKLVIPCRQCEDYISDCIESLIGQDYSDWECIIADDASCDATQKQLAPYLNDPRITFRTLEKRGWLLGNTLDALRRINPAPTDVVAILDGDDMLLPGALSRIMREHAKGFDVVWTDMEIQGLEGSTGAPLIEGVPIRQQLWCLSQLRSFKGYLLDGIDHDRFLTPDGTPYRAAGDLALYFPLIERAGAWKTSFIPEKLYYYRVHECCNFKVLRNEQLNNNAALRTQAPLSPQTEHFDFTEHIQSPEKLELRSLGQAVRERYPMPYSVCVEHRVTQQEQDSWRAYHNLWIAKGVYLKGVYE